MGIISVSVPDSLTSQMDHLIGERGYAGRSDFVRAAVRDFIHRLTEETRRGGRRTATMTLVYPTAIERRVSAVAHDHGPIITSVMHSHVARERCVTVYIVEGEANRIREFATEFRKIKDVEMVMPIYTDGTA